MKTTTMNTLRFLVCSLLFLVAAGGAAEEIVLQLPLDRATHSFSIRQWDASVNGYLVTPLTNAQVMHMEDDGTGTMVPTQNSFMEATGAINLFNDYVLLDETTGETGPPNEVGMPSFQRTSFLTTPWFVNGEASSSFFVSLPAERHGHVFTLFAQGVSYALSTGPLLGYSTTDGNGQPVIASYGFFEGWSAAAPGGAYFLVDQNASEQSDTRPPANRDFVSNTTWTPFTGALPTRLVTLWLAEAESTNTFEMHTAAGSLSWVTPSYAESYDSLGVWHSGWQISAAIGVNQDFWVVRQGDGATASGTMGIEDVSLDWTSAFPSYTPPGPDPYTPNWQTVSIPVGENHWNETIVMSMSDGSIVYPTADWANQGFQAAYDTYGVEYYRYHYVPFTATIDANLSYTMQDSGGHTELMDGYNPPPPPEAPPATNFQSVSVQVGENHWGHTISVFLADGSAVEMQPDWGTQGYEAAVDGWGNTYYTYAYVSYVANVDVNQGYTIRDSEGHESFMDGFNPPTLPSYQTVSVQVGENHWSETIVFTLADGSVAQAEPDWSSQGWQAAYDGTGTEYYRYNYMEYKATIDVSQGYTASNAAGHADLMDGFNPPPLPSATVQVGEDHWGHEIYFHLNDGSTVAGTPDWSTQGFQAATDGLGNEYYRYLWVNYTAALGVNQSVVSVSDSEGHTALCSGFNPPPPPEEMDTIYLSIAASRWQHQIEVHTSGGDVFPVQADHMQGFWSVDPTSQSWWNSYYFFTATSQTRLGQNWWVVDATTGETAEPGMNNLSLWTASDANVDTDGDGLVDWYEALIGSDVQSTDSDSDGMRDDWEVLHHLSVMGNDATGDADGDGWTNLEEFQMSTDPRRGTVWITIIAPAGATFIPGL